jgi:hypothetical protein
MHTKVSAVVRRFVVPAALALGLTGFTTVASADPFGPGGSRAISSKDSPKAGTPDHSPPVASSRAAVSHLISPTHKATSNPATPTTSHSAGHSIRSGHH